MSIINDVILDHEPVLVDFIVLETAERDCLYLDLDSEYMERFRLSLTLYLSLPLSFSRTAHCSVLLSLPPCMHHHLTPANALPFSPLSHSYVKLLSQPY